MILHPASGNKETLWNGKSAQNLLPSWSLANIEPTFFLCLTNSCLQRLLAHGDLVTAWEGKSPRKLPHNLRCKTPCSFILVHSILLLSSISNIFVYCQCVRNQSILRLLGHLISSELDELHCEKIPLSCT